VTPDTEVATPTATSPAKEKRARKPRGKSKQPAAPKADAKPRAKPRTLRSRINDLGDYCLEAFDRQRKRGGESYETDIRLALDCADELEAATTRHIDATAALACATTRLADAQAGRDAVKPVLDRLYAAAKGLAQLDGGDDTPPSIGSV